jgi:hypothetical protein
MKKDMTQKTEGLEEGLIKGLLRKLWVGCRGSRIISRTSKAELAPASGPSLGLREKWKKMLL